MIETISYEQFQEALRTVQDYKKQVEELHKEAEAALKSIHKFAHVTKETSLYDSGCSVRLQNVLIGELMTGNNARWWTYDERRTTKLGELSRVSVSKFLKARLSGKKTMAELKELCFYADIELQP